MIATVAIIQQELCELVYLEMMDEDWNVILPQPILLLKGLWSKIKKSWTLINYRVKKTGNKNESQLISNGMPAEQKLSLKDFPCLKVQNYLEILQRQLAGGINDEDSKYHSRTQEVGFPFPFSKWRQAIWTFQVPRLESSVFIKTELCMTTKIASIHSNSRVY